MRHFALALVLACVLSGTASAGEIPTTGTPSPPPPSPVMTTGETPLTEATETQGLTSVLTMILTLLDIVS
ncbi:MAG TPA: hypothetical protein VFS90_12085 [Pyrinomonadaceae bacterium]|nr:hypothetical protein [Pyrinomonadaceae bacterium]